jgi:hypothetical protein
MPKPSADDYLTRAEQALAEGDERDARWCLTMAKIRSNIEQIKADVDLEEEADDA